MKCEKACADRAAGPDVLIAENNSLPRTTAFGADTTTPLCRKLAELTPLATRNHRLILPRSRPRADAEPQE